MKFTLLEAFVAESVCWQLSDACDKEDRLECESSYDFVGVM